MSPNGKMRAAPALLLISLVVLFAACTQPGDVRTLSSEKTFVSLSFLQANNASLSADYVAAWNAAERLWVTPTLPATVETRQLKASFTLSDGARCYVGTTAQVSGATPNDFGSPVQYRIVAEDGSETTMTVKLQKAVDTGPTAGKERITVGCWNVNDCDMDDGITRYGEIAAAVKAAGIDILILCEVQQDDETGADIGNLKSALAATAWPLQYDASVEVGGEDDIAVLSSYPISTSYAVLTGYTRPMIRADVTVNGRVLHLIGGHLKAFGDDTSLLKRRTQAKALADYLRSAFDPSTDLVVVGGDMNTVSAGDRSYDATISPTYPYATLGYLQLLDETDDTNDFWAVNENVIPSESTHRAGGILDHLILSPAAKDSYVGGTVDVYGAATCSDHYPVCLELDL
jgi:endonuclease/exonuclease/phosphatase family metal-dependent hydrolase